MKTPLSMIVAVDKQYGIGKDGKLLFRIPEDQKFFKDATMGNVVVMGRTTYESIGKPLQGRLNIVLTTRKDLVSEDDNLLFMNGNQFEEWLENDIPKDKKCFIIGGGQVYYEFIDQCDTIYMTTVDKSFDADTFFPDPYEYGFVKDDEPNDISLIKYGIHSDLISDDPEANIAWGILKLSRK